MKAIISIFQIIVSVLLAASILLQQRGTGLSATFGGEGNVYRTKRGVEKVIFYVTIVLIVLLLASAVASIIL
ncbi:MAG: preprotein translocase subunit SecG [Candidatus Sungbacteria bacterium]|uniref:Protein-export membrane protein SecG n=1 Tax=Candidatus Sungiibacteriota bacterium TaxID=2750080 RepID=A0A9D6LR56_9BACT|nr:preprotein translocase subunit SecG [Candidatus Sungbacteria bacterium]